MRPSLTRSRRSRDSREVPLGNNYKTSLMLKSRISHSRSPRIRAEDEEDDYLSMTYNYSHTSSTSDTLFLSTNPSLKLSASNDLADVTAEKGLKSLIDHYNTVMVSPSTSSGPKGQFYPFAVQHETLFHTIMYCSSAHRARLQGYEPSAEAVYHHSQAIRLFNQRLEERPSSANLHALISATCLMFALESFEGTPENCILHWDGLSRLVQAAGGLESIILHSNTRRNVLWADLAAASALAVRPRFDPYTSVRSVPIPLTPYFGLPSRLIDMRAQALGSKLCSLTGSIPLSQRAATVYWGLSSLSNVSSVRQLETLTDTADPQGIQMSDRIEMLERVAVPLWCDDREFNCMEIPFEKASDSSSDNDHPAIFKIFGFALLIHIYASLRDVPLSLRIMNTHAERILAEMDATGPVAVDAMCQAFPEMMVWIFFLAGKASKEGPGRLLFARRMAEILASMGVQSKKGVEEAAGRFLNPKSGDVVDWDQVDRLIA